MFHIFKQCKTLISPSLPSRIPAYKLFCKNSHRNRDKIIYYCNQNSKARPFQEECPRCSHKVKDAPANRKNIICPHKNRVTSCLLTSIAVFYIACRKRFFCKAGTKPKSTKDKIPQARNKFFPFKKNHKSRQYCHKRNRKLVPNYKPALP